MSNFKINANGEVVGLIEQSGINPSQLTATIAINTAISPAVDLLGKTLVGYIMPAAWTAAALTFQTSPDGVIAYADVYDSGGTEISHTVAASRFVRVNPADWVGIRFLKLRSGTGALPVNQAAAAAIILVIKAV